MSTTKYTITFTVSVNTDNCDPDVLDEVEAHVQDGVNRMLEGKFPSGDMGPDQSYTELVWPSVKVEEVKDDGEWVTLHDPHA